MNIKQMDSAKTAMTEWLSDSKALGKAPAQIQCVGELELDELHYYLFKYKKSMFSRWLLGVCGGYTADALEHCGHVISLMEPYHPGTAQDDALRMIHWFRGDSSDLEGSKVPSADSNSEHDENAHVFLDFVLLENPVWDREALLRDLNENWGIELASADSKPTAPDAAQDTLILDLNGALLTLALMPCPIPGSEAQQSAARNFSWKGGVEQTARHQAHVIAAVVNHSLPSMKAATFLVKAVCSVCRQEGVVAVCANRAAYPVQDYLRFAQGLQDGELPFYNLVWVGLGRRDGGVCGYTCGLTQLGYDELEILDSNAEPRAVHDLLSRTALHVLQDGVTLHSGETVGLNEEQQFLLTRSEGVSVPGMSLKIDFCV